MLMKWHFFVTLPKSKTPGRRDLINVTAAQIVQLRHCVAQLNETVTARTLHTTKLTSTGVHLKGHL